MAANTSILGNTNPGINEQLMTAQQQLALAQALRGQSLKPLQAPGGQNGVISPLSALAQALNTYSGSAGTQDAMHNLATAQAAQSQNQIAMMAKMLNPDSDSSSSQPQPQPQLAPAASAPSAQPSGPMPTSMPSQGSSMPDWMQGAQTPAQQAAAPGATAPTAAATAPAATVQDPRSDPRYRQMAMAEQLGVLPQGTAAAYAKAKYDYGAPTDQMKNDTWAGVTPQQRATIATTTTMAPNQSRVQVGPNGQSQLSMVAPDPDKNLQYNVGPNGQVSAAGVPGAPVAAAQMTGANATATADAGIRDVTLPNGATVPVRAGPAAAAGGTQAGIGTPWTGGQLDQAGLQRLQAGAAQGNPDARAALAAYQRAQPQLGQPSGTQESIQGMSKKWEDLAANNGSAQQAISLLSNIKQLADQAITGTASDRISFANGLLAQMGVSDRATTTQTATDLLNKNVNRMAALFGQGSMTTDAARAIGAAANPNGKMNKDAIKEAADDITGQYRMIQAKTNVLLPYRNGNDAQGYNTAETKFNQVADPRVWRLQSMAPQDAAAYIKRMAPADAADLLRRRTEIMKNGWLQ